jgi:hypothetical protein
VKPSAQVSLDRTRPARSAGSAEAALARRCRVASRPSALTADPMRRPAGPSSIPASTRDARLTDPRLPNPRSRGPKATVSTGDAVRRPHPRATPSRPERVRSAVATRVRQVATAARSAEASRFRAPERTGQLSRLAPDPRRGPTRGHLPTEAGGSDRPLLDSAACSDAAHRPVRSALANTHVRVRVHEPEPRRSSPARTAQARTRDRQARTSRPKTPPWGSVPSSGIRCADRSRRFASPTPSALSVSHALSGFIPTHPRGLVSCHIHS